MMINTFRRTLLATIALGLLAGLLAACGGTTKTSSGSNAAAKTGNVTDRAFVNDMIPHHRSAVQMAQIALGRNEHPEVKRLATGIVAAQNAEIATMQQVVKSLPVGDASSTLGQSMHAMGMDMNTASLRTARPFDRAFIDMMSPHHTGAIAMARIELAKGTNPRLRKLAQAIIQEQTKERAEMTAWRAKWFGSAPAGGMPSGSPMG